MRKLYQVIMVLLLVSCTSKKQIEIVPFNPYFKENTKEGKTTREVYFLVKNWATKNENRYDVLNEFSDGFKQSDTSKCNLCAIIFYKESDFTNETYKESESDLIEWHSKDLIFSKGWQNNKVIYVQRFRNGEVIDSGDVKMIDIRSGN